MELQIKLSSLTCLPPKIDAYLFSGPNRVKIPTSQISPLHSVSSLSFSALSPPKPFFKFTFSANSPQNTLSLDHPCSSDRAEHFRVSIVWFRNDLRVNDNECLNQANKESEYVLPIYIFDPSEYDGPDPIDGTGQPGEYQCAPFKIEAVSDLRKNLRTKGSDLVLRIGKPESVLVELAKTIGAEALYAHREFLLYESAVENDVETLMKDKGIEINYFWGNSTLYHVEDFPFELHRLPINYLSFIKVVGGLEVRKPTAALDRLKGLPNTSIDLGEIPSSLVDLGGCNPSTAVRLEKRNLGVKSGERGGETVAIEALKKLVAECQSQPQRRGGCGMVKWLRIGCLSRRFMFHELKTSTSMSMCVKKDGMNGILEEMLLSEYICLCCKYSYIAKQRNAARKVTPRGVRK